MISDHVFKSDNPESTVNETAEMDLYRASLVSLQSDIAAANSQAKTNVKVGVVMLDSEVKFFRPLELSAVYVWLATLACLI